MKFSRAFSAFCLLFAVATASAAFAAQGGKIKKCQDAAGMWHYGDTAADECAQSKIEVMSEQGIKQKEIAAPPTAAQLKDREARRAEDERKKLSEEERKKKDDLLLATYPHENDILFVRDRKLAQLESQIKATEGTLKSLTGVLKRLEKQAEDDQKGGKPIADQTKKHLEQTRHQIANRQSEIATKRAEQENIRKQSDEELARYRELKRSSTARSAASDDKK
jgi:hypothetical protein